MYDLGQKFNIALKDLQELIILAENGEFSITDEELNSLKEAWALIKAQQVRQANPISRIFEATNAFYRPLLKSQPERTERLFRCPPERKEDLYASFKRRRQG